MDLVQIDLNQLLSQDSNKRNILHRSALQNDFLLMKDCLDDFENLMKTEHNNEINSNLHLKNYINSLDKFGNSPLVLFCSHVKHDSVNRIKFLKMLLDKGADVNIKNSLTLWNSVFWAAYHGEEEIVALLLEHDVIINSPDYEGFYPLDIAGKQVYFIYFIKKPYFIRTQKMIRLESYSLIN